MMRLRLTVLAMAGAASAALAVSLLVAIGLPHGAPARLALVALAWLVVGALMAYLFLPGVDLPWRLVRRVRRGGRLALTIDDGPHPETTPALLDALRVAQVPATFFLVGAAVERWPDLARRIVEDGHAIGNHTQRHRLLVFRTHAQVAAEIDECQRALAPLSPDGQTRWFRPPHGFKPIGLHRLLARRGLRLVAWQGTIRDTDAPGEQAIVERALAAARDGRILLLHDNPTTRGQSARAIPELARRLRANGFELVPLDDVAGRGGG